MYGYKKKIISYIYGYFFYSVFIFVAVVGVFEKIKIWTE